MIEAETPSPIDALKGCSGSMRVTFLLVSGREDMEPPGSSKTNAKKLEEHLKDAGLKNTDIRSLEKRSMALCLSKPSLPAGVWVIAARPDQDTEGMVSELGGSERSADCVTVCRDILLADAPVVWLCMSEEEEKAMFWSDTYTTFTTCARLLGGGVGTAYWLKTLPSEKQLVQTIVGLKRGLSVAQEICFGESLEEDSSPEAKGVAIAYEAAR